MPTITLNKKVFERLVGKTLPIDKLKDRISMLGTDLEGIDGNDIKVEIFPNRPDMLSEQGFARAFSSFIGEKKGLRKYNVKRSGYKLIVDKSVAKVRPYTACAIVKNLKFDNEKIKEIIQIQEKLHVTYGRNRKKAAIGVYPLEKITFPIKFVGKDSKKVKFLPLEAKKEMTGLQVLSQHPAGREYGALLEGLNNFPFFIDANNNVLSMPPIINSHETGKITENTKEVFVECSGFDFNVLKKCLNMVVTSLSDMGGEIYSLDLVYPDKNYVSPDLNPEKIKLDLDYANKILGLDLNQAKIKNLLERMGYGAENLSGNKLTVLVPSYRADILHQIDLIEDIAIAYGYDNFKEEIPKISTVGDEAKIEKFKNSIANILVGFGLNETKSYELIGKEEQTKLMGVSIPIIPVSNPVTFEYNSLRAWIIPSLLQILKNNLHNEYPQRIFDLGTIFKKDKSGKEETGIKEDFRIGCVLCEDGANFTTIKQIFDGLMNGLGIKYDITETDHKSFISGRVGRVSIKGNDIAYIGEIHPRVLENFGIEMPTATFELNITELFNIIK